MEGEKVVRKYSPEFKLSVIMDMRENKLSRYEVVRKYWGVRTKKECLNYTAQVRRWERKFLFEGEIVFMTERRGKSRKNERNDETPENDLAAENKRLRKQNEYLEAELEYIKKLSALVYAEEQKHGKRRK
jgi:hypothetical protein